MAANKMPDFYIIINQLFSMATVLKLFVFDTGIVLL